MEQPTEPTPLVSVIVPCYNVAPYIARCLDSILASTYRNLEILIVNDGSTDNTLEICQPYSPLRQLMILSQPNAGVSAARNAGLDCASGKYILFVDPDDYIAPSLIGKVVHAAEATNADYVMFGFNLVNETEGHQLNLSKHMPRAAYSFHSHLELVQNFLPRVLGYSLEDIAMWYRSGVLSLKREWPSVWSYVYRRDLIERHKLRFDRSIRLGEDRVFNCWYIVYSSSMVTVMECLYFYVQRLSGITAMETHSAHLPINKLRLLQFRDSLRGYICEADGIDIREWYAGSNVFGLFELLAAVARHWGMRAGYTMLKRYVQEETVHTAVRDCPVGGGVRFALPLVLAKARLYPLLLLAFRVAAALGHENKL